MEHPWIPGFLTPLELEYLDGRNWRVNGAFQYETSILEAAYGPMVITIPDGFETDFASTPRIVWPVLPPTSIYGKPAVIHDRLYRTKGLATKAEADAIFLEAMTLLGVGWWTRTIMYRAVRLFGGSSYQGGLPS
jgi:hypothetical protein